MKRAGRIILNVLAVVSLLLCVVTAGMWVRSYWMSDLLEVNNLNNFTGKWVTSHSGAVGFCAQRDDYGSGITLGKSGIHFSSYFSDQSNTGVTPEFLGFGWFNLHRASPDYFVISLVPYWFLFTLTMIQPCLRVVGHLRRRRQRNAGLCQSCGYDLRATPDRCPECGTVPTRD